MFLHKPVVSFQILVMSATMDVDHFSAYFNAAPVLYLEGRQYPVQVTVCIYTPATKLGDVLELACLSVCLIACLCIHLTACPMSSLSFRVFINIVTEISLILCMRAYNDERKIKIEFYADGPT
jgi:hypothetical protein